MNFRLFACVSFLILLSAAFSIPKRDYDTRQYFIVEIDNSKSSSSLHNFIASNEGTYRFEHPVRGLDDHFVFSLDINDEHAAFLGNHNSEPHNLMKRAPGFEEAHDRLVSHPGLKSIQMLYPKRLEKRMPVPVDHREVSEIVETLQDVGMMDFSQAVQKEIRDKLGVNDPLFFRQWHLVNSRYPGNDVNVKNLWYGGIRGANVTVAVIDDGLDHESEDLRDNFSAEGSWDFNDNQNLPTPRLFDDTHGTKCAGEIAAVRNDACGIGVAYEAKVAGIRILSGRITSEDEAAAMIYGLDVNDIYSCSWGPNDHGTTVAGPDMIVKKAVVKGVQEGRQGKGAVYVFASGNGRGYQDQCNFDGYTNSIYSITVSAIDHKGLYPPYAEACSAVMVVTYSSGSGEFIQTTDVKGKCTSSFTGTSAAAPLAAGIYALVLQANPKLTWRDVQHISARSAVTVNEDDGGYQETALGLKYSHRYGYGKIDAEKLVEEAKSWVNVKPQAWYYSDIKQVDDSVKSTDFAVSDWISSTITVTEDDLTIVNFEKVEHVTVTVNIESTFRGQILVRLRSPHGLTSTLAERRSFDKSMAGLQNWTFMSVAHLGEDGLGDWTLEVSSSIGENKVTLKDWQLRLFGESIDAEKAEKYDVTKDYAAERRDLQKNRPITSPDPSTSSEVSTGTFSTDVSTSSSASSAMSSTTSTQNPVPSTSPGGHDEDNSDSDESDDSDKENDENKKTPVHSKLKERAGQFFLLFAVFGFVSALIVMNWYRSPGQTRRRRGDDYEFEIIPEQDSESEVNDNDSFELSGPRNAEIVFDSEEATLPGYIDVEPKVGIEEDAGHSNEPILGAPSEQSQSPSSISTPDTDGDRGNTPSAG